MASLKAVLQGNTIWDNLLCCQAVGNMLSRLGNMIMMGCLALTNCIGRYRWKCVACVHCIAVYVRSKSRWLLPRAFVWCRFTCDPYKPWSADPMGAGTLNLAGWCSTDLLAAGMGYCRQACSVLWLNEMTDLEHSKPGSDCSASYAAGCMKWDKCRHCSLLQTACGKALNYIYSMQLLLQQLLCNGQHSSAARQQAHLLITDIIRGLSRRVFVLFACEDWRCAAAIQHSLTVLANGWHKVTSSPHNISFNNNRPR